MQIRMYDMMESVTHAFQVSSYTILVCWSQCIAVVIFITDVHVQCVYVQCSFSKDCFFNFLAKEISFKEVFLMLSIITELMLAYRNSDWKCLNVSRVSTLLASEVS
mmetsp:Transcript_24103/g.43903  ORF Transcript_24103/g.43903 Transcript_24103/m.43903 type:complete len:106 (-) Transcript_24103:34-351(-)